MWRFPAWFNFISFLQPLQLLPACTCCCRACHCQAAFPVDSHMLDPEWCTVGALTWSSLYLPINGTLNSFATKVNKQDVTHYCDSFHSLESRSDFGQVKDLEQHVFSLPCSIEGELGAILVSLACTDACKIKFTILLNLLKPPLQQKNQDCPLWQFLENIVC